MADAQFSLPHKLTLNARQQLTVTGVSEVVSFDEGTVVLQTGDGVLLIQGSELQLKNLSLEGGQVAVDGRVSALIYQEPRPTGSWLRRLLK